MKLLNVDKDKVAIEFTADEFRVIIRSIISVRHEYDQIDSGFLEVAEKVAAFDKKLDRLLGEVNSKIPVSDEYKRIAEDAMKNYLRG